MCRPDGPHAVSLEKDLRMARISKSPGSKSALGASETGGGVGVGPAGCLDWSSCHVTSSFGAVPDKATSRQAFTNKLALEMADEMFFNYDSHSSLPCLALHLYERWHVAKECQCDPVTIAHIACQWRQVCDDVHHAWG